MSLAFTLLVAALAAFWFSTRQFQAPWRLLVWLSGAALLVASVWFVVRTPDHFGLFRAIADALGRPGSFLDSPLVQAFERNSGGVARFIPQLLDLFQLAAAILGIAALLAFTPGERLERTIRPLIFALGGFMLGGAVALSVAAIGFGGYIKPRTYFGYVNDADIHDGDTFRIGEVSLRLFGADALELDQICPNDAECGSHARDRLVELTAGKLVQCDQQLSQRNRRPRDSFGRALVTCSAQTRDEGWIDIGARMIEEGYAVQYEGRDYGYSQHEATAAEHRLNIMAACNLRPDHWRNRDTQRAYLAREPLPADAVLVGSCSAQ